jgi:SagB-type dehydrogenase family enzyme
MESRKDAFTLTELDETNFAEFRDCIIKVESEGLEHEARTYPGYPNWPLERLRPRLFVNLEKTLLERRSKRNIDRKPLSKQELSRLLQFAHGITGEQNRGPVPSSGELQALELYLVNFTSSWLDQGIYHYDRVGHHLSQISPKANYEQWKTFIPSTAQFEGGSLFFVIVGDGARVLRKYGKRGARFLFLEAGHLMQNLCLVSTSLNLCTLPLGGFFEKAIARELSLPSTDFVLYLGACGKPYTK